jgi:hypothetical protein
VTLIRVDSGGKGPRGWNEVCRESKGRIVELEWDDFGEDWKVDLVLKTILIIPLHILSSIGLWSERKIFLARCLHLVIMLHSDDSNGNQCGST